MTLHFSRAARRFVRVFGERGIMRCHVVGVRGEALLVRECGLDAHYAPVFAVIQVAPTVFAIAQ